ncbi:MAG: hypothetical protein WDA16_07980 [Candidatus Thermoplasmatota archaeon]
MLGKYWIATIVLSAIAFSLALGLLIVYTRNWRAAPSRFSRGLLVFSGFAVLANAFSVVAFYFLAQDYGAEVALPLLGIKVSESAAYGALFRVTWE